MSRGRSQGREWSLLARMLCTALLVAALYIVLIAVLVAAGLGAVTVAVIAGVAFLANYFGAERLALRALRARPAGEDAAPELHALVERLAVEMGVLTPKVAIIDSLLPDVYTVGRAPSMATICVTSGLLGLLAEDGLEAVVAHELAHLRNRDVTLMTLAGLGAAIAALIVRGGVLRRGEESDDSAVAAVALVISGLAFIISFVLLGILSSHRELAADRRAVQITGRPRALAYALTEITDAIDEMAPADLRRACGELAAFAVVAPPNHLTVAGLCPTHPPLHERLLQLRALEARLREPA
jgi:heat shock protein HtpX